MISPADIKSYLRDLFYIEEDILKILHSPLLAEEKMILQDTIVKKQIIITKIVNLIDNL